MIDEKKLAEWEELEKSASSWPWDYVHGYGFASRLKDGGYKALNISDGVPDNNIRFITAARTAVPLLLDEVKERGMRIKELEADVAKLKQKMAGVEAKIWREAHEITKIESCVGHHHGHKCAEYLCEEFETRAAALEKSAQVKP